jgi:hypothetical protein
MKKLLTLIAVLALTATVFAAEGDPNVVITCEDEGGKVVRVDYQLLDEDGSNPGLANKMRGIALDITVDGGATIDSISDYDALGFAPPVDSAGIDAVSGYIIYMGSIQFATDPNYVSGFGDPVAPNTDPDALGGLTTTGITVEMGSLYSDAGTEPPASGTLFKIAVSDGCIVTIAANTTRGGCVLEDGSPANVISGGCEVLSDCMAATNPQYNDWLDWANNGPDASDKPACWCYQKQCHGDTDGALFGPFPVAANDFDTLKGAISLPALSIPPGGICADLNHDAFGPFRVAADDFAELKRWISLPNLSVPVCSGPGCVGFQGNLGAPQACDANPLPNSEYVFWTN